MISEVVWNDILEYYAHTCNYFICWSLSYFYVMIFTGCSNMPPLYFCLIFTSLHIIGVVLAICLIGELENQRAEKVKRNQTQWNNFFAASRYA